MGYNSNFSTGVFRLFNLNIETNKINNSKIPLKICKPTNQKISAEQIKIFQSINVNPDSVNELKKALIAPKCENYDTLLAKWVKGNGAIYFFDAQHPMTQELQKYPKLQEKINEWILEGHKKGDKKPFSLGMFLPIGEGTMNMSVQFVGTMSPSIYQISENKIGVLIANRTSLNSALYHVFNIPKNDKIDIVQWYYFEEEY